MKTLRTIIILSLFLSTAAADVLVEQLSIPIGNPQMGNSAVTSTDADVIIQRSQAYDNFVLSKAATISALHWTGAYHGVFNPNPEFRGETDFLIQFLRHLPEQQKPGVGEASIITSFMLDGGTAGLDDGTQVRESIIPNQAQRDGGAIVRYEAELESFELEAGSYWLMIQAQQVLPSDPEDHEDPEWSWVLSTDGDRRMFSYDELFDPEGSQPGVQISTDVTFTLLGESLVTDILGDFDDDGLLEAPDINILSAAIREGSTDLTFDVNQDGSVSESDHDFWVTELKGTFRGDADLNGVVNFDDFVSLVNHFNQTAGWAEGNFDPNTLVNFDDFVWLANNFNKGTPFAAGEPASVPEPSAGLALSMCSLFLLVNRNRRRT